MDSDRRYSRRAVLGATVAAGAGLLLTACGDRADAATVSRVSPARAGVSGAAAVRLAGSGLDRVHSATIDGVAATITARAADALTLTVPPQSTFTPGTATLELFRKDGRSLAHTTFTYTLATGIDRQLNYVLKYWQHYNPAYPALPDDDCVDFTSQSLLQRGWKQQGEWTYVPGDVYASGEAWRGSTAFHDFMVEHPELGTALTDDQRDRVKLGDVVQFDWGHLGDRDHTGVVTRITKVGTKIRIFFAGHTDDSDFRSVDTAITKDHPGGTAYYWSLA